MLSSECAWRVLRAEHVSMRKLSDSVDAALRGDGWRRPGPGLEAVRAPLQRLQTFDDATHRPKGVVLMSTLRGRSAQADALLDELGHDREHCDRLLARALTLLDAIEAGDAAAADALPAVLDEHRHVPAPPRARGHAAALPHGPAADGRRVVEGGVVDLGGRGVRHGARAAPRPDRAA